MTFTPWTLLIDVGIVSLLLLLGKLLRSKVRIIQRFFIPPSLLAGITALVLGPEVLGWLPLS
ncbi:MAG: sodium:glutamate symporter, partial [Bacteroidales bacterium]|nr:sodium:glutamate symporter [Bacteroidales bacterium]